MSKTQIQLLREEQKRKYAEYKKQQERTKYYEILSNFSPEIIDLIIDKKIVNKIQSFFRKYRFGNKNVVNLENIINYDLQDIIKVRANDKIYGFHFNQWLKHFDIIGYSVPIVNKEINLYQMRRINSIIKKKNKFNYQKMSHFEDVNGVYTRGYYKNWTFDDIHLLFESRGLNRISVKLGMYEKMLELDPNNYALEIITDDCFNFSRAFASFADIPQNDDFVHIPMGIYSQLNSSPENLKFKFRIIKPIKGERVVLKCMINNSELISEIKKQLTKEIGKHKILSKNQIIIVESDVNHSMIPFIVESCEPSNVIDITNVDLEIDFAKCLDYDDPFESMLIYLNR